MGARRGDAPRHRAPRLHAPPTTPRRQRCRTKPPALPPAVFLLASSAAAPSRVTQQRVNIAPATRQPISTPAIRATRPHSKGKTAVRYKNFSLRTHLCYAAASLTHGTTRSRRATYRASSLRAAARAPPRHPPLPRPHHCYCLCHISACWVGRRAGALPPIILRHLPPASQQTSQTKLAADRRWWQED